MNKTEFLTELERRIRVLDKNEIKDILAEYSQHIDMKTANGMSEAEAIKAFGDMDSLTAEILEAYHVNPEYQNEDMTNEPKIEVIKKRKGVFSFIKGIFSLIGRAIKKLWKCFIGIFAALFALIKKPFVKKELTPEQAAEKKARKAEKLEANKQKAGKAKKGITGLIKGVLFICLVIFVILCLIPLTLWSMASIFSLGVSLVMFIQGYPMIGIVVLTLGLSVMSVSLSLILISFIIRKKPEEQYEYIEDSLEEADAL